jgi:hypothetical protein
MGLLATFSPGITEGMNPDTTANLLSCCERYGTLLPDDHPIMKHSVHDEEDDAEGVPKPRLFLWQGRHYLFEAYIKDYMISPLTGLYWRLEIYS